MLKVFLVEDETVIREGLRDNIEWEEFGYKFVGEAADGEMALPLIRKTKPDVLITDIKMPFMDGLSLSKIVSSELPDTKIIIISGYDDFEYARQAIELGVEQYLLKPITRMNLKKVLADLREKIEQSNSAKDYQLQYSKEMHEYEQFERRRFFEDLLSGKMQVKDIYEEANKLSLELTAASYNLLFFYIKEERKLDLEDAEELGIRQEEILYYFLRHPQYILFRQNTNTFGILVKGDREVVEQYTQKAISKIAEACVLIEKQIQWYVAVGEPVERLSLLADSAQNVNHYLAYRFFLPQIHILTKEVVDQYSNAQDGKTIDAVDYKQLNPEIIKEFLYRGNENEVADFVESYLLGIAEALESRMFRDYIILNIRFSVEGFLEETGIPRQDYQEKLEQFHPDVNMTSKEVGSYFQGLLSMAMEFNKRKNEDQGKSVLSKVVEYIDQHYEQESLSLNEVAEYAEVSASYLSATFSQGMQVTFVEYVTQKRMEKAKKLLRTSTLSTGEVSAQVGFKDPHYFSFVFKKTQGMSPREYRSGKAKA